MNMPISMFQGKLTFHLSTTGVQVEEETCAGVRDTKETAANLAVEHGEPITVKKGTLVLCTVDKDYLDLLT